MKFFLEKDIKEIISFLGKDTIEFENKRILITGGRGFLGRYFTEVFKELNNSILFKKIDIVVSDNLITSGVLGDFELNNSSYEFYEHNVIEEFKYEKKIDFIIHAAGIASPYYYRKWPLETLEVATNGLKNSLKLAQFEQLYYLFRYQANDTFARPAHILRCDKAL